MSKKMLINATHPEENRVAIVEDGILCELDIEIAGKEQTKGNIYKASVVRIEPGLQAAFVDYGAERFGFLQLGEIHPSYFPKGEGGDNRRPRINDILRRGQELLVQIVKEERGTKGAALTTFLSLPGRYMVLMPESDTKGVSRKIEDESQRKKLKEAMASLDLPAQMGYIVRTAGIGQKKEELKRDFDYLVRVYRTIREQADKTKAPALIYKESNLAIRSLRDYFSADMDEVLVDDPKVAEEAREFFQQVMPEYARLVKLHQERRPIFSRYQIEEQIDTISKSKVQLPSGGSIVIDPTEALVSIDVNSGKMAGEQGVESTAYKTNLEAATEVARQLRLRDLGGLIVIDFIDMRDRKHIREVEKCLKDAMKYDKARVTVGRISQFGLLEMSRQRIKAVLAEGSFLPCPHCDGTGKVKSAEAQAIAFLRKVHSTVAKGQIGRVEGEVPLEVATYLLNLKREELLEMERRHQMVLVIKGRPDFTPGQSTLTVVKREKDDQIPDQPERAAAPLVLLPAPVKSEAVAPTPEAPESAAPQAAAPESVAEEDAGKRKRKRRRRKKKGAEPGEPLLDEGAETEEEEESFSLSERPEFSDEAAMDAADEDGATEEEAEASAGEGDEKRKKRRRRRRKKPAAAAEGMTAQSAETTPASQEPSEARQEPSEARQEPSEARREPSAEAQQEAPPAEQETPQEASAAETVETPSDEAAPPSSVQGEDAPPRKGRPARRRGKKPEESAPASAVQAHTAEEAPQQPPAQEPAAPETAPKETPQRSAAADELQKDQVAAATQPEPKRPAPAKKRAPRKKAQPQAKSEEESKKGGAQAGEEAPKKRTARPRKAASETKKAQAPPSDEAGAEAPPARQRRTTRKKDAETETPEQ